MNERYPVGDREFLANRSVDCRILSESAGGSVPQHGPSLDLTETWRGSAHAKAIA
jgi:hypothetical protein